MATFLLRVRGGLDPDDGQAPVLLDIEREALEIGDEFPIGEEVLKFRGSDGRPIAVPGFLVFRCVDTITNNFFGPMWVVEKV